MLKGPSARRDRRTLYPLSAPHQIDRLGGGGGGDEGGRGADMKLSRPGESPNDVPHCGERKLNSRHRQSCHTFNRKATICDYRSIHLIPIHLCSQIWALSHLPYFQLKFAIHVWHAAKTCWRPTLTASAFDCETMDSTLFNKQTPKGVRSVGLGRLGHSERTPDWDPYLSENTAQKSLPDRRSKCRFWRMEFLAG